MSGLPSPDPRGDLQPKLASFKQLIALLRESDFAEAAVASASSRGGIAARAVTVTLLCAFSREKASLETGGA